MGRGRRPWGAVWFLGQRSTRQAVIRCPPGARDAPEIHWRGVAFDRYVNGQWSRSKEAPPTNQTLEQSLTRDRRVLLWTTPAPGLSVPEIERLAEDTVKQEVWLDPLDSDVLFGASNPRIVEYAHTQRRRQPIELNDEIRLEHGSTVHYTVYSDLRVPSDAVLRASSGELRKLYKDIYLQLPEKITDRTRELAKQIIREANAHTTFDKAVAIKAWLARNATYTLELKDPGDQEPIDFFLFDRKQGHCEYFASAFAILARSVDVPVRQVNGFLGGEWNEYQNYIAVRAGDAHSWDEVFFPGVEGTGVWVTFDPTPAGDVDQLGRGSSGWRAKIARFMDTLRFQWAKWVIEYDLVSQLSLFKSLGGAIKTAAVAIKDAAIWLKNLAVEYWPISTPLGSLLIVALVIRRRRRRAKLPPELRVSRKPRQRSTVAEIYDGVAKQLAKAGFARTTSTTPRELAGKLAAHPAGTQVSELVELYYGAEWGGRRDASVEDRAAALAAQIKQALRDAAKLKRAS